MAVGLMRSIVCSVVLYLGISLSAIARAENSEVLVCKYLSTQEEFARTYLVSLAFSYLYSLEREEAESEALDAVRYEIQYDCEYPELMWFSDDSECIDFMYGACLEVNLVQYEGIDGHLYDGYALTDGMYEGLRNSFYNDSDFRTTLLWNVVMAVFYKLIAELIHSLTHYSSCETVTVEERTFTIDDGTCADRPIFG